MTTLSKLSLAYIALSLLSGVPHRAVVGGAPVAAGALALDEDTVIGPRHLSTGYPSRDAGGAIHAVVEIPAGTTAKFEVDDDSGALRWVRTREDGSRRAVDYLAYPASYGMIPRTLAADGDPLDALILGAGLERGRVARTRVIGVLATAQDGVRDDKLIAVPVDADARSGFSDLDDLPQLDERYPAARAILELWIANCWGRGATEVVGWGDAAEAAGILTAAERAFSSGTRRPAAPAPRPRAARPSARPGP